MSWLLRLCVSSFPPLVWPKRMQQYFQFRSIHLCCIQLLDPTFELPQVVRDFWVQILGGIVGACCWGCGYAVTPAAQDWVPHSSPSPSLWLPSGSVELQSLLSSVAIIAFYEIILWESHCCPGQVQLGYFQVTSPLYLLSKEELSWRKPFDTLS